MQFVCTHRAFEIITYNTVKTSELIKHT